MLVSFFVSLNILPPFRIFIAITVKQIESYWYFNITLYKAVGIIFSTSRVPWLRESFGESLEIRLE